MLEKVVWGCGCHLQLLHMVEAGVGRWGGSGCGHQEEEGEEEGWSCC